MCDNCVVIVYSLICLCTIHEQMTLLNRFFLVNHKVRSSLQPLTKNWLEWWAGSFNQFTHKVTTFILFIYYVK